MKKHKKKASPRAQDIFGGKVRFPSLCCQDVACNLWKPRAADVASLVAAQITMTKARPGL